MADVQKAKARNKRTGETIDVPARWLRKGTFPHLTPADTGAGKTSTKKEA